MVVLMVETKSMSSYCNFEMRKMKSLFSILVKNLWYIPSMYYNAVKLMSVLLEVRQVHRADHATSNSLVWYRLLLLVKTCRICYLQFVCCIGFPKIHLVKHREL